MTLTLKELIIFITVYMNKSEGAANTIIRHFVVFNGLPWRIVGEDEIFDISVLRNHTEYFEISAVKVMEA